MEEEQCNIKLPRYFKYDNKYIKRDTKKNKSITSSFGIICFRQIDTDMEILFIRRKDTIGYIEFLRGKYNIDDTDYIRSLVYMMTEDEKQNILKYKNYDTLRTILGLTGQNSNHRREYDDAREKFNTLINNGLLEEIITADNKMWNEPEWGLPKGRRNVRENEIICAVREFYEETGLTREDIILEINIKPLEEIYEGINGVVYRHVYYFARYNDNKIVDGSINLIDNNKTNHIVEMKPTQIELSDTQKLEISKIGWFRERDIDILIRDYYQEKKKLIHKAFQILNSKDKYFTEVEIKEKYLYF